MIAKEVRDRIVADVSGDLSPTESERLLYELLQDPEARQMHQSLQRDRDALRNLHRLSADSDLSNRVLMVLARQSPIIRLAKKNRESPARWPLAVGLALGLGLAFVAAWLISDRARPTVADHSDGNPAPLAENKLKPAIDSTAGQSPNSTGSEIVYEKPSGDQVIPPSIRSNPESEKKAADVLTAPSIPRPDPIKVVKPRISLPMSAADFGSATGRESFRTELMRDSDHRIELFTHDSARLADDLIRRAKSKSQPLLVEPVAGEIIRRKGRAAFAVFVENWAPNDLISHFRQLAQEQKFETMVLTAIADGDRRELRQLLGRDPLETGSEVPSKAENKRARGDLPAIGGYLSFFPPPKVSTLTKDQLSFCDRRSERSPGKLRLYLILRPL